MARKTCIFCGRKPVTREHILPDWLNGTRNEVLRVRGEYSGGRAGSAPLSRTWETDKLFDLKARIVCGPCNSGWMSDIENKAKPFIEPMVLGKGVELTPDAQSLVALWTSLRVVTGYYAFKHFRPLPDDWLASVRDDARAPENWTIVTTGYRGKRDAHFQSTEIGVPAPSTGDTDAAELDHGVVTTILVGYLALKVFALRRFKMKEPGTDAFLRIWPASSLIYRWPPPECLGDDVAQHFIDWGSDQAREPPADLLKKALEEEGH